MHHPLTDIQADYEINRITRHQITAKRNYFHRRQTDGRTDIAYENNRYFLEKKKKLLKSSISYQN